MDKQLIERKFERLGARVKIGTRPARRDFAIDIRRDRKGEYFEIQARSDCHVDAIDVRPRDRHLLLMVAIAQEASGRKPNGETIAWAGEKQKFLCGHDERSWFVAAVPDASGAGNVPAAMEALKPAVVVESQARNRVTGSKRNRRKNRAFRRQGEWFFVPCPDMSVDPRLILKDEPMQRSGGKPHWAEFAYRTGGEVVFVSRRYPNGLTPAEYQKVIDDDPKLQTTFRTMRRNATMYVKGRISHPDHKTIALAFWHRVEMNTEAQARARANVVFLD